MSTKKTRRSYIETVVYPNDATGAGLPVIDYESASYGQSRLGAGGGTVACPYGSAASKRITEAHDDFVPVRMRLFDVDDNNEATVRDYFQGWVDDYKASGPYGNKTVTATIIGQKAMLAALLAWPNPAWALGVQPGYDVFIGNAVTGILSYIRRNAARTSLPVIVLDPVNPDTSYLMNWAARMVPIEELVKDTLPELSQYLRVQLWLPGDDLIRGHESQSTPVFVVEFVEPTPRPGVSLLESEAGVSVEVSGAAPKAATAIVGGKSPDWLNNVLSGAIGTIFPAYKDALANVFLAYQSFDQPPGTDWGPFAPREKFVAGGVAAYTLDSVQAGRQGILEARGKRQRAVTFTDGSPYTFNVDFGLGDTISVFTELDAAPVDDVVAGVKVSDTRGGGVEIVVTIGEDKDPQDGLSKMVGRLKNLFAMIATVMQGSA